ncbi:MAG TPA: hypothetical protein VK099_01240 [Alcanivoracaceae bacterium]|nr:hypothetical protein [Alcanivoracaceae bacterium]
MSSRKEYIERLTERLKNWDQELDVLEAKAKEKKASLEVQWKESRKELLSKRDELKSKLDELKNSADDRFDKLKDDLEERFEGVKSTLSELKKKHFD